MSSPTYNIVAGDGQTYGANSRETIQAWIREGRVARETQMSRSDVEGWFRAGDYQEFTWPAEATATPTPAPEAPVANFRPAGGHSRGGTSLENLDPSAVAEMRAHGSWFFWIAGFELFYGLMAVFNGEGAPPGTLVRLVIFGPALLGLGFLARQAFPWAFVLGGILVAFRLYEAAVVQAWFAVAIRAWALFEVFKGFNFARELRKQMRGD